MSRTINDSINQLETSLSNIKTSLNNKNVEGGGAPLKVSEVAGLIDQIQSGGGKSNEIDLSNAFYMQYSNKAIIVWPYHVNDEETNFFETITGKSIVETTLTIEEGHAWVYVGVFNTSESKVEIRMKSEFDGDYSYEYSGLIDISSIKLFVITDSNSQKGQEPKK